MNITRRALSRVAQKFELPIDVVAMLPRIEVLGTEEFSIEPHEGLREYSKEHVVIMSSIGMISVFGKGIVIRQMSAQRIVLSGCLLQISFAENAIE